MIRGVIFDFDDTIANTGQRIHDAYRHVFSTFKHFFPKTSEDLFLKIGLEVFEDLRHKKNIPSYQVEILTWYKILDLFKLPYSTEVIFSLFQTFNTYLASHISFEPGFPQLHDYSVKNSYKEGILTNGSFYFKAERLKHLGIAKENFLLITSDMMGAEKPELKGFKYILNQWSLRADEVVFVGDSLFFDINPAKQLGMIPVLYMPDYITYDKPKLKNVKYKVTNLNDLVEILITLNS